MSDEHGTHPLFADPKRLLLDMAQEQALPELLRLIGSRLGDSSRVALNVSTASMRQVSAMCAQYGKNFMWFRRGGCEYVIRDRTLMARFEAL